MRFIADLARGLWRLAVIRTSTQDNAELRTAKSELGEALVLYQQLAIEHPRVHADDFVGVNLALDDVDQRIAAIDSL